jgi:hypothetical protein
MTLYPDLRLKIYKLSPEQNVLPWLAKASNPKFSPPPLNAEYVTWGKLLVSIKNIHQKLRIPVENVKLFFWFSFSIEDNNFLIFTLAIVASGNTKGGKYHCTIDLLFDWFGTVGLNQKHSSKVKYSSWKCKTWLLILVLDQGQ